MVNQISDAEIHKDLLDQDFYLNEDDFKDKINKLNDSSRQILINRMRNEKQFYKKILEEKYREKNPESYRYRDADIRIEILNRNGKILKSVIGN